jgi:cytochrome c1
LLGAFIISTAAACSSPSSSPAQAGAAKPFGGPTPNPTVVAEGQALIQQKGCGGCHAIPGIPGATGIVGPSLPGVASRTAIAGGAVPNNGPDDLKRWILDPPAVKPGTAMPKLGLTDDEATKIVGYLETLR